MSKMRRISSQEFNQDVAKAKRATEKGPVFITDRGTPAHVLLTVKDYYKLLGNTQSVADLFAIEGDPEELAKIPFDLERTQSVLSRETKLT